MAQSAMSPRPRFVTLGILWGALLGIPLTLLAAVIPSIINLMIAPNMGGESLAYLMVIAGTYCGILFLPAMVGGGIVGALLGLYYRRHSQRVGTRTVMGMGVGMAVALFLVVTGVLYLSFRESLFLDLPYGFALMWLIPTLILMMVAYSLLSSWLNRRLPK